MGQINLNHNILEKKSHDHEIKKKIDTFEQQHKHTGSRKIYHQLFKERECLKSEETTKTEHNLLYLKHLSWQNSPKAQKMLAWRVKKKRAERTIYCVKDNTNQLVYSNETILESFQSFCSTLYISKKPHLDSIE